MSALAGCGADDASAEADCTFDTTVNGVTVTGSAGAEPTVTVEQGTTTVDELVVQDLCTGSGAEATTTSQITADYLGVAMSTGETFDSSYASQPLQIPLASLIPGFQQGVEGMAVGGVRLLIIPGALAYGEVSPGPGIGPNESLIFTVELLDVAEAS